MSKQVILAPSILSADFSKLAAELADVERCGVSWFHVDVMDGAFVPNITIGPVVVESLRKITKSVLDCHLMVADPAFWVEPFAKAGADYITLHAEAASESVLKESLKKIRALGKKSGISINPATPVSQISALLDDVDLVLVMSVNPGFAGQKFMGEVVSKLAELKQLRGTRKYLIEIDGGIGTSNIKQVVDAGAEVIVAGSAVFAKADRGAAIQALYSELKK